MGAVGEGGCGNVSALLRIRSQALQAPIGVSGAHPSVSSSSPIPRDLSIRDAPIQSADTVGTARGNSTEDVVVGNVAFGISTDPGRLAGGATKVEGCGHSVEDRCSGLKSAETAPAVRTRSESRKLKCSVSEMLRKDAAWAD